MTHSSASQKCFMAALISIACWIPVVAQAQDSPPNPAEVTVSNIAFRGDACRTGTFVWNLSSDAKAFTLLFSEFAVSADPTTTKARKLCELDIQMRIPSGWSFALLGVDIRGYAGLKNEVSRGHVRAVYAFGRSRNPTLLAAQNFQGPFDQDYVLSSDANVESYNWSPCAFVPISQRWSRRAGPILKVLARCLPWTQSMERLSKSTASSGKNVRSPLTRESILRCRI